MHKEIQDILKQNQDWAAGITAENPNFFTDLAKQQSPKFLWIGCADSRVPANEIIGRQPGEVFVHRNIANVVVHSDLNCLSVMQYAVEVLQIEHIILCGHYGCGGIEAALEEKEYGLIDNWLRHIQDIYRFHKDRLTAIKDPTKRMDLMCELNVKEQVANICNTTIVRNAWKKNQKLAVHGLIYSMKDGILKDLLDCNSLADLK